MKFLSSLMRMRVPPVVQLTVWYTLIIMVISVTFSVICYRQTTVPFRQGFVRGPDAMMGPGSRFAPLFDDQTEQLFIQRYEDVTGRVRNQLIFVNLAILFGAGLVSYFLAKRTLRPIEDALDEQRRFVADASHELRTPLTAMKTEIEVALKEKDSTEHTRALKSALEEVGKLTVLSSSLLQLARHEDEQKHTPLEPVELSEVIDEACHRVGTTAEQKNITIQRNTLSGKTTGDRMSLIQLFSILLDNAVKYSAERTTVKITETKKDRRMVVAVTDEGIGISASDLPYVFRRFYRASASRSKKEADGYGLGLSIAKQIVDQHHGAIEISSVVSKGTTVTVTLLRNVS
ncbi:MAG: HAMP domain-containing sensor histidine kinase [Candidatus Kerfeldbacteria bacterium]